MKYDVSLLIPAIRTNRWSLLIDSLANACKDFSWQVVFVGPFGLPDELKLLPNIKHILEYGTVTRAIQKGALELDSDLMFSTVDDCIFAPDSIDLAIRQYLSQCTYKDAICMRYKEGGDELPMEYWRARKHGNLQLGGIQENWMIAMQFLMNKNYFQQLGGFDCQFEYSDKAVHDFMFRLQKDGGKIVTSPTYCCIATWYRETTGDHAPIHFAQVEHDEPLFQQLYSVPTNRIYIDYNNWKNSPEVWDRRFNKGVPDSYESLVAQQGYII